MNFSEAMFYENYLTSDFRYKHCYFKTCLPTRQNGVENRDKAYGAFVQLEMGWTFTSSITLPRRCISARFQVPLITEAFTSPLYRHFSLLFV